MTNTTPLISLFEVNRYQYSLSRHTKLVPLKMSIFSQVDEQRGPVVVSSQKGKVGSDSHSGIIAWEAGFSAFFPWFSGSFFGSRVFSSVG